MSTLRTLRKESGTTLDRKRKHDNNDKGGKKKQKPITKGQNFRFKSDKKQLQTMTVDLSKLKERTSILGASDELISQDDYNASLFGAALRSAVDLNLTEPFVLFYREVEPLSRSLPLIVLYQKDIVAALCRTLRKDKHNLGLCAASIVDLIPPLLTDLNETFVPHLRTLLPTLINLTNTKNPLPPATLQRIYDTMGFVFRELSVQIVENLDELWPVIRVGLGHADKQAVLQSEPVAIRHEEDSDEVVSVSNEFDKLASNYFTNQSTRRLLATSFSFLIRGVKSDAYPSLFQRFLADIQTEKRTSFSYTEGIAYLFIKSGTPQNGYLHSKTAVIMSALYAVIADKFSNCDTVFTNTLIGLLHHVKNADDSKELVTSLLSTLKEQQKLSGPSFPLKCITVLTSVCGGRRLHPSLNLNVFDLYHSITALVTDDEDMLQNMAFASFPVLEALPEVSRQSKKGEIKEILSRLIAHDKKHGYRHLCSVVSMLFWKGWSRFYDLILPDVLSFASSNIQETNVVTLLSTLNCFADPKVSGALSNYADNVLTHTSELSTDESHYAMLNALNLVAPNDSRVLHLITKLSTVDVRDSYKLSPANPAHLLGEALKTRTEPLDNALVSNILSHYYWHREVLQRVVPLAPVDSFEISESVTEILIKNLLSHDGLIRLSSLHVLSRAFGSDEHLDELINACIQAESIPVSFQTSREKCMRVRKLGILAQAYANDPEPKLLRAISVNYLTAMLKVNLKPLWSDATEALVGLAHKIPHQVFNMCANELILLSKGALAVENPEWFSAHTSKGEGQPDSAFKSVEISQYKEDYDGICIFYDGSFEGLRRQVKEPQVSTDRLVIVSYESLLLDTLSKLSVASENELNEICSLFLTTVARIGDDAVSGQGDVVDDTIDMADEDGSTSQDEDGAHSRPGPPTLHMSQSEYKQRAISWLNFFARLSARKNVQRYDEIFSAFVGYLSYPDTKVQGAALESVLKWTKTSLSAKLVERLHDVLDTTKLRDVLLLFVSNDGEPDDATYNTYFIRLLFGLMTSRMGRSASQSGHGLAGRRAAILGALARCPREELDILVDLMLRGDYTDRKKQSGFLGLLGDVVKHLSFRIVHRYPELIWLTLDILKSSTVGANAGASVTDVVAIADDENDDSASEEDEDGEDEMDGDVDVDTPSSDLLSVPVRALRTHALKRFVQFFRADRDLLEGFDFSPFLRDAFPTVISPRLPTLAAESAQTPSELIELFVAWSHRREDIENLVTYDATLLPSLYACLSVRNVKPAVVNKVLDVVDNVVGYAEDARLRSALLVPYLPDLLAAMRTFLAAALVARDFTKTPLGQRIIETLRALAPFIDTPQDAYPFTRLVAPLLRKPNRFVNEPMKVSLVKIVAGLWPAAEKQAVEQEKEAVDQATLQPTLFSDVFEALSALFLTMRTRTGRLELVNAFTIVAGERYPDLCRTIADLNSYSTKRTEEPDFDRRMDGFDRLNDSGTFSTLDATAWTAVLFNMLHYVQDADELSMRLASSLCLRHFVDVCGTNADLVPLFSTLFLPRLRSILLYEKNNEIRSELMDVFGYCVKGSPGVRDLDELKCLLMDGDEEANVFNNILHIQVHRRTRAMRRLCDIVAEQRGEGQTEGHDKGPTNMTEDKSPIPGAVASSESGAVSIPNPSHISSRTLSDFIIPLLNLFMLECRGNNDVINESVLSISRLGLYLDWQYYLRTVNNYLRSAREETTPSIQKAYSRILVGLLKSFHFDLALAENEHISEHVQNKLVPDLVVYIEKREEGKEDQRIPVVEGASSILEHLIITHEESEADASRARLLQASLLSELCQILRTTNPDLRELTRRTLCNIVTNSSGCRILPVAIKEMASALARGPQLHVLAFTAHALLVQVDAKSAQADDSEKALIIASLGQSLPSLVPLVANDIFGNPSRERMSQEFKSKSKFKEVKQYKSLDSYEILARHVTYEHIATLLAPVRNVLERGDFAPALESAEKVLNAIVAGLVANANINPVILLDLSRDLVSQNASFLKQNKGPKKSQSVNHSYFEDLKNDVRTDYYALNAHYFVAFGLNLFNTAFRKSLFDLHSADITPRLEEMVNCVGNALYSDDPVVLAQSMKAAAALIQCPLSNIDDAAPVYMKQMLNIVYRAGSTESDLVQSVLGSLALVIRNCKSVRLTELQLKELLELVAPDLTQADSDKQSVFFGLIRAIMSRRFACPELYDIMDKVVEMMVTSQSTHLRQVCRAIYLTFLMDYQQSNKRLSRAFTFLAQNLSYVFESGRLSVLEFLQQILVKFPASILKNEYLELLFVQLVRVVANDEAARCKEMAAEHLKTILVQRTANDESEQKKLMGMLFTWASTPEQAVLQKSAIQALGAALSGATSDDESSLRAYTPRVVETVTEKVLADSTELLDELEEETDASEEAQLVKLLEDRWPLCYQSLQTLMHASTLSPESFAYAQHKELWHYISKHLIYPHQWVRIAASRLLGRLFSSLSVDTIAENVEFFFGVARRSCIQLESKKLTEALSLQIVKNLFFLGKNFMLVVDDATDAVDDGAGAENDDDDEVDTSLNTKNPLKWLFSRLSYQCRRAHMTRPSLYDLSGKNWSMQPTSILKWFAAMANHMKGEELAVYLTPIAIPIYRIIEDPNSQDPEMEALQELAKQVQDVVQKQAGASNYAVAYNAIRQRQLNRRAQRKAHAAIETVKNPAQQAAIKAKKNEKKTRLRKRKNAAFADTKQRSGVHTKRIRKNDD